MQLVWHKFKVLNILLLAPVVHFLSLLSSLCVLQIRALEPLTVLGNFPSLPLSIVGPLTSQVLGERKKQALFFTCPSTFSFA